MFDKNAFDGAETDTQGNRWFRLNAVINEAEDVLYIRNTDGNGNVVNTEAEVKDWIAANKDNLLYLRGRQDTVHIWDSLENTGAYDLINDLTENWYNTWRQDEDNRYDYLWNLAAVKYENGTLLSKEDTALSYNLKSNEGDPDITPKFFGQATTLAQFEALFDSNGLLKAYTSGDYKGQMPGIWVVYNVIRNHNVVVAVYTGSSLDNADTGITVSEVTANTATATVNNAKAVTIKAADDALANTITGFSWAPVAASSKIATEVVYSDADTTWNNKLTVIDANNNNTVTYNTSDIVNNIGGAVAGNENGGIGASSFRLADNGTVMTINNGNGTAADVYYVVYFTEDGREHVASITTNDGADLSDAKALVAVNIDKQAITENLPTMGTSIADAADAAKLGNQPIKKANAAGAELDVEIKTSDKSTMEIAFTDAATEDAFASAKALDKTFVSADNTGKFTVPWESVNNNNFLIVKVTAEDKSVGYYVFQLTQDDGNDNPANPVNTDALDTAVNNAKNTKTAKTAAVEAAVAAADDDAKTAAAAAKADYDEKLAALDEAIAAAEALTKDSTQDDVDAAEAAVKAAEAAFKTAADAYAEALGAETPTEPTEAKKTITIDDGKVYASLADYAEKNNLTLAEELESITITDGSLTIAATDVLKADKVTVDGDKATMNVEAGAQVTIGTLTTKSGAKGTWSNDATGEITLWEYSADYAETLTGFDFDDNTSSIHVVEEKQI